MDTPAGRMSNSIPQVHQKLERRHIWLIIGPAGCGKSTIGDYTAKVLHLPFIEGDNVSYQNCILLGFYHIPYYNNISQSFTLLPISKRCLKAYPSLTKIAGAGSSPSAPLPFSHSFPHTLQLVSSSPALP